MKKLSIVVIVLIFSFKAAFARTEFTVVSDGVIFNFTSMTAKSRLMKVEVWSDNSVKIIHNLKSEFSTTPSLIDGLIKSKVKFKADYSGNNVEVTLPGLIVSVTQNGLVSFFNRKGQKLILESDRSIKPSEASTNLFAINERFFMSPNEILFGLGQSIPDSGINIRNKYFEIKQTESDIVSPIVYSDKGYAIIWDNYSESRFEDAKSGMVFRSTLAEEIQYFIIYGPSVSDIIGEIRSISGKAPLLPKWAFNYWVSRNSIESFNAVSEKFAEAKIPVEGKNQEFGLTRRNKDKYASFLETEEVNAPDYKQRYENVLPMLFTQSLIKSSPIDSSKMRRCAQTSSVFTGLHRNGVYVKSLNAQPTWEGLRKQVMTGINLSLSGSPYWSTNIGGMFEDSKTSPEFEKYKELYLRWLQFAAFTPIFQSNGFSFPDEILEFGKAGEPIYENMIQTVKNRSRLLPYIYTLASDVVFKNKTLMRSLAFDYPTDAKVYSISNEYMLGPSLLIAPVLQAGINVQKVYLPNSIWFDFWTGNKIEGGKEVDTDVSLERIPLYVKAGTIIPLSPEPYSVGDTLDAPIEIRIFPGLNSEFSLYNDSGDSYKYEKGEFSRILFEYNEVENTLVINSREGQYPDMPAKLNFSIVKVDDKNGLGFSKPISSKEVQYVGKKVKVKL